MITRRTAAALVLLAAAAAGVYLVKYQVAALEVEEAALANTLAEEQAAIHVLALEWAWLNDPARLAELAERHLDVAPLDANTMIDPAQLPRRKMSAHAGGGE